MNSNKYSGPISFEEWKDIDMGKIGTPERDFFELEVRIEALNELLDNYNDKELNRIIGLMQETKNYLRNAKKSLPADSYIKFEKELNSIENRLKKLR